MLTFDNRWRFDSPGPIEGDVEAGFLDLINRISGQGQRKAILEHFKARFAAAANVQYYPSSNERFAVEDLTTAMGKAATNAPLFIEAFWTACEQLQRGNPEMVMPDAARINRILADAGAGYQLDPPMTTFLGISERGNHYLRRLLIHGARSCVMHLNCTSDRLGSWLTGLEKRMHTNKVTVALAAKIARVAWVILYAARLDLRAAPSRIPVGPGSRLRGSSPDDETVDRRRVSPSPKTCPISYLGTRRADLIMA